MTAVPQLTSLRERPWWVARKESRALLLCATLTMLAVLPYLNALSDGYTMDDEPQILTNPAVNGGVDPIGALASPLYPGNIYRPLTIFTFAVNQSLAPSNAAFFHAVNLALHAVVTLLVFWLALRLFRTTLAAAIAGALFAVHPLHTEAVTSLVGRAEELTALFGLLTLLTAIHMDETSDAWTRRGWHLLSVVCFVLAAMSKESGLTVLPLVLLLRSTLRGESLWRGLWTELRSLDWVPYLLCAALLLKLRAYVTGGLGTMDTVTPLENMLAFVPSGLRIRTALGVLWDYLGLMHFPLLLSADYSTSQVRVVESWWELRCLAGAALLFCSVGVVLFAKRRSVAFAMAIPLVMLSLTSNLLFAIGTVKAERLLYAPSIGWALLVGLAFEWCFHQARYRRAAAIGLAAMLTTFAIRTWVRNPDWLDNAALHQSAAMSAPNSAKARYNYAVALQNEGDQRAAMVHYRAAFNLYPWAEGAALGIGIVYEKTGDVDQALVWYRRALDLAPSLLSAHSDLCRVLYTSGRYSEAVRACREGLRYEPTNTNLLKGLGGSLIATGEKQKGIAVLHRALLLDAADTELGKTLAELEGAVLNHSETGGVQ